MRYKNYTLSKGDKVKLNPVGDVWLPSMTKKYGGKVVTIKDFIHNIGFVCEPLGNDVVGYLFSYNDIDEVVYCKNNEDKIKKYEIKKGLECCAAVGSETSCSDCSYVYRCRDLCKDALDLIIEQEKEIEQLTTGCHQVKEFAEQLKARITKFIWRHNIPECIFNDIMSDLLKRYEE